MEASQAITNFDDVFDRLGHFGKFQYFAFAILAGKSMPLAAEMLIAIFVVPHVPHRCQVPGLSNDTYHVTSSHHSFLINNSIPCVTQDDEEGCSWSKCDVYSTPGGNTTEPCSSWVFDHSTFQSTITEQFSLVCERKLFTSHMKMTLMLGILFGAPISGQLADLYGRKLTAVVGYFVMLACSTVVIFSPNVWMVLVLRFFVGFFATGVMIPPFIHFIEMIGPRARPVAGNLTGLTWVAGCTYLTLCAYLIRDWKYLQLASCLPWITVTFLLIFFIPESPRWLLTKRRMKEAGTALNTIAKWNKKPALSEAEMEALSRSFKSERRATLLSLFKSKTLALRSLVIWFCWFVFSFVYYGINWNSGNFSGNIYLNFLITSLVEIPSYFAAIFLMKTIGRKVALCGSLIAGGACCLFTIVISLLGDTKNDPRWFWGMMSLVLLGKLAISLAFSIGYVYTSELFSTSTRTAGQGVASMSARVGGAIAPYVADLPLYVTTAMGQSLSQLIYGVLSIAAGLLALLLPETRDLAQLPDSLREAKSIGRKTSNTHETDVKVHLPDSEANMNGTVYTPL